MKTLFPGYYPPSEDDFTKMWKEGLFVLDANVLLNLYRYPQKAREELLAILSKMEDRLWLPFHAAIEYQRNRPSVIAEQKGRFQEVKQATSGIINSLENKFGELKLKKRHSLIDPDELTSEIKPILDKFHEKLESLDKLQVDVFDYDQIRSMIDGIFDNRVGSNPSKEFVERIMKDAEWRFSCKMPPGFADEKKDKGQNPSFHYGGITYHNKYGDLMVWEQIIDHASTLNGRPIIFITDDEKPDWWWTAESQGAKRLGPRPELVEEIKRRANINLFYMYNSENFLRYAPTYLMAEVSQETIDQVRNTSKENSTPLKSAIKQSDGILSAIDWLSSINPEAEYVIDHDVSADIVGSFPNGEKIGYEIVRQVSGLSTVKRIETAIALVDSDLKNGYVDKIEIVAIARSARHVRNILPALRSLAENENRISSISLVTVQELNEGEFEMILLERMA